jgi:hypothetical protein
MRPMRALKFLAAALALVSAPALAQLGLPSLPGGVAGGGAAGGLVRSLPGTLDRTTGALDQPLDQRLDNTLDTVNRDVVGRPLEAHRITRDPEGFPIAKDEIVAVAPSIAGLAAAKALQFTILRQETLPGLGLTSVVFTVPDGMSAEDALAVLRKADPAGRYDYDHLYDPSGATASGGPPALGAPGEAKSIRIGMIDGGVYERHPAFWHAKLVTANVTGSKNAPPSAHGTAVASLLVGDDGGFHGYLEGAELYAADVYGGDPSGGSADDIVRALEWLAVNRVAVANISLAGPPNALLEAGVEAFVARGHVLVAAIGNEGPAGPRQYPANYPGVVAVTSVDDDKHLQLDASGGAVTFAALGVDVRAAALRGYGDYTGTSFAAPAVAARFALVLPAPDPQAASRALAALEHSAMPLGKEMGYGYLGAPEMALAGK